MGISLRAEVIRKLWRSGWGFVSWRTSG
jgi:hypothetical protein